MADKPMTYGKKPNPKVAKGALAGAAASFAQSDKNYRAEETFRDAIKAAKRAGCSDEECEKIIGSAVVTSVDRYGDGPMAVGMDKDTPPPRGLEKTIQKLSSAKLFHVGFITGVGQEMQKQAAK